MPPIQEPQPNEHKCLLIISVWSFKNKMLMTRIIVKKKVEITK